MKYIINVNKEYTTNGDGEPQILYKADEFNSLVFDQNGLDKLEKYDEAKSYDQGLHDAWQAAIYVVNCEESELKRLFRTKNSLSVLMSHLPSQVIKIFKNNEKICVGDEITYKYTIDEPMIYLGVLQRMNGYHCAIGRKTGNKYKFAGLSGLAKTGEHIDDISDILFK